MKYKEFGNKDFPTIIMLHGGGLSWWSLKIIAEDLSQNHHVITPIIDGHGEDGATTFISIEDSAQKLISFIDEACDRKVFAIYGLSLGAQIAVEVLSKRADIAEYAIIESALLYPIRGTTALTVPSYKLFYGLISKRWFAKMQAKALFVPNDMFELYFEDSLKMTRQSLINITLSNGNYQLKDTIGKTSAKVLIIVGSKELGIMKKSSKKLQMMIKGSALYSSENMGHGEISLVHYQRFLEIVRSFFTK